MTTALNTFITNNIPRQLQLTRDYVGPQGWVHLCNQLLRRFEKEGLIPPARKEIGAEVSSGYWVNIPSDMRSLISVVDPTYGKGVAHAIVNGMIKLRDYFSKDDAPTSYVLSEGGTLSVKINDADGAEDEYLDKLLVLTNGTFSGEAILIGEHPAASGGTTLLNFQTPRSSIATSTAGYIVETYVKLQYMATFTPLSASGSTIPIDQKYEDILISGFHYLASEVDSKSRAAYMSEFEYAIELAKREIFTPTIDQAKPQARSMAAYENCENITHSEFVGDEDAWING